MFLAGTLPCGAEPFAASSLGGPFLARCLGDGHGTPGTAIPEARLAARLSSYNATSARLKNSCMVSIGLKSVHPLENRNRIFCSSNSKSSPSMRPSTRATSSHLHSGSIAMNSSPPSRTARSDPRIARCNRSAKLLITVSPAA